MDDIIRVLILKDGRILVTKIEEVAAAEIGEPDCVMIDPVVYDDTVEALEKSMKRFPGTRVTNDKRMAILSDNILTMVAPHPKLLSEYLVVISD